MGLIQIAKEVIKEEKVCISNCLNATPSVTLWQKKGLVKILLDVDAEHAEQQKRVINSKVEKPQHYI